MEHGIVQRWEPPDTMFARYVGHLQAEDIRSAHIGVKTTVQGLPYFLMLIDASRLTAVTGEARRAMAENGEVAKLLRGTAIVGASFHFRALGTMIARAVSVLNRHDDNPIRFFSTEAEGRAWLEERRRTLTRHL